MDDKILEKLKEWVEEHYSPYKCSWVAEHSYDNYDDCFSDGEDCGMSWAAYLMGCIIGMKLEAPYEPDEEDDNDETDEEDREMMKLMKKIEK